MSLTTKETLERCKAMWEYIAKHECWKHDAIAALWPGEPKPIYGCWACESAKELTEAGTSIANCEKCPIWPPTGPRDACGCERLGSPYEAWIHSGLPSHALAVAELCDEKLKELEELEELEEVT